MASGDSKGHTGRVLSGQPGPTETTRSPWSAWGARLAAVLGVAIAISLAWAWIETFYRGVAVNAQLSYKSFDRPRPGGLPIHTKLRAIIGDHYFGDFQLPLAYAKHLGHSFSPLLGRAPEQYPPFVQVLFTPLTFLPLGTSALIYLALSAAVFLVPLWLLLAPLKAEFRIIFLTLVAVLTTPFISFLDRGNDIGIAVGLVAWAIWAWRKEQWVLCGIFLAAAIALKAYPAGLLLVPLGLRRYRFTAVVAASAVGANLLILMAYPKGYVRNLWALLPALLGKSTPGTQLSSWSLYSIIPKTAGLIFGSSAVHQFLAPRGLLIWLPSVLYVLGVYFVIRRRQVPQWCWGPLTLATIQLLVPLSFVYTTAWAPLAAVWFAWGHFVEIGTDTPHAGRSTDWVALRIMLLLALVVTLAPWAFTFSGPGGFKIPLAEYLSPALLLLTLCTAIIYSLRPTTLQSSSAPIHQLAAPVELSVAIDNGRVGAAKGEHRV